MIDPHFTLHPPAYFHLRSGNNPSLIEGLVWTKPEHSALVSPWIRFISNPFRDLGAPQGITPTRKSTIQTLHVESDESSIAVNFDFVDEGANLMPLVVERKAKIISWHDVSLLAYARPVAPQKAALGDLIRG